MNDLYNELQTKTKQLDTSVKLLRTNGSDLAQKEHDYKIKVLEKVFEMKESGTPATLINLVIYGDKEGSKIKISKRYSRSNL